MFRKIIVLIISALIGLAVTTYSVTKINIEGLKWFAPKAPDIQLVCGDHWGGLPFSIVYTFTNQKPIDKNLIRVPWVCPQEVSYVAMFVDLFIWTFATYVGIESGVKLVKTGKGRSFRV